MRTLMSLIVVLLMLPGCGAMNEMRPGVEAPSVRSLADAIAALCGRGPAVGPGAHPYGPRLSRIIERIVSALINSQPFAISIVPCGHHKNGFAAGTDEVVVLEALVNDLSDSELAFVLAHEFGHLTLDHGVHHESVLALETRAEDSLIESEADAFAAAALQSAGFPAVDAQVLRGKHHFSFP